MKLKEFTVAYEVIPDRNINYTESDQIIWDEDLDDFEEEDGLEEGTEVAAVEAAE